MERRGWWRIVCLRHPSVGRGVSESDWNLALPVRGYGSSERGFQAEMLGMAVVLWLVTESPETSTSFIASLQPAFLVHNASFLGWVQQWDKNREPRKTLSLLQQSLLPQPHRAASLWFQYSNVRLRTLLIMAVLGQDYKTWCSNVC